MSPWVEVSPLLARACEAMSPGQMVHDDDFNLAEAMLAIEVGEARMDMGMVGRDAPSAEELLASGAARADLDAGEILALARALFRAEATWHKGSMLPLTVFTSLHLFGADGLRDNQPLHALCRAIRTSCTLVHDIVLNGQVCEDEDILVHTAGLAVLDPPGRRPREATLCTLREAVAALEDAAPGAPELRSVLSFYAAFIQACDCLLSLSEEGLSRARTHLSEAQRLLASLDLSTARDADAEQLRALAFVPDVHRRHLGLIPPRPAVLVSSVAAGAHWESLLAGLELVCERLPAATSWPELCLLLEEFAAGDWHALVRSAMHTLLARPQHQAQAALAQRDKDSVAGDGRPSSTSPLPPVPLWCPSPDMVRRHLRIPAATASPHLERFCEEAGVALAGAAHLRCLNRCRQRRRARRSLEDWRHMADHAFQAQLCPLAAQALDEGVDKGGAGGQRAKGGKKGGRHAASAPAPPRQWVLGAWAECEALRAQRTHLYLTAHLGCVHPRELSPLLFVLARLAEAQQRAQADLAQAGGAQQCAWAEVWAGLEAMLARALCVAAWELEELPGYSLGDGATPFNGCQERWAQRFDFLGLVDRPPAPLHSHYAAARAAWAAREAGARGGAAEMLGHAACGTRIAELELGGVLTRQQSRQLAEVNRCAAQNAVALKLAKATLAQPGAGLVPHWDWEQTLKICPLAALPTLKLNRKERAV